VSSRLSCDEHVASRRRIACQHEQIPEELGNNNRSNRPQSPQIRLMFSKILTVLG
jgi:hypothetical protein